MTGDDHDSVLFSWEAIEEAHKAGKIDDATFLSLDLEQHLPTGVDWGAKPDRKEEARNWDWEKQAKEDRENRRYEREAKRKAKGVDKSEPKGKGKGVDRSKPPRRGGGGTAA
jgi:hypothetical protein